MKPEYMLRDTHAHLAPLATLAGLSAEQAEVRAGGAPHSVAELVAHVAHWQDWFCQRCRGERVPAAARAADGWPPVEPGSWDAVRERFAAGLEQAMELAAGGEGWDRRLGLDVPLLRHYTLGDALAHLAQHNSHHLGQVVLLRQLSGSWPPPAGGMTW